eukprot:7133735-Prorocentrum_lima.AAC.1
MSPPSKLTSVLAISTVESLLVLLLPCRCKRLTEAGPYPTQGANQCDGPESPIPPWQLAD